MNINTFNTQQQSSIIIRPIYWLILIIYSWISLTLWHTYWIANEFHEHFSPSTNNSKQLQQDHNLLVSTWHDLSRPATYMETTQVRNCSNCRHQTVLLHVKGGSLMLSVIEWKLSQMPHPLNPAEWHSLSQNKSLRIVLVIPKVLW